MCKIGLGRGDGLSVDRTFAHVEDAMFETLDDVEPFVEVLLRSRGNVVKAVDRGELKAKGLIGGDDRHLLCLDRKQRDLSERLLVLLVSPSLS